MAVENAETKRKRGRPAKTLVPVVVELSPGQVEWLEQLVNQLYGTDRESILKQWITERLNQLCEEGRLRRPAGSVPPSSVVVLDKEKDISQSNAIKQQNTETKHESGRSSS